MGEKGGEVGRDEEKDRIEKVARDPWNWFRSTDHWKQSSLLNSPPTHPTDIKVFFGMIYREPCSALSETGGSFETAFRTNDKFYK